MIMPLTSERRPIVVGVDPDPAKRTALAWAVDEAARRRLPLRLVHADDGNRTLHLVGDQVLKTAVVFAESRRPEVEVTGVLAEGTPARVLLDHSREASALVLGSWHLGRVRQVFAHASVALPVVAHAHCPVVVVPEPEHTSQQPAYFVVGVDGSAGSTAAVDHAVEAAARRGAQLRALYVWQPGVLGVFDEHAARQECRRLLSEATVGRSAAYPDVELHHELLIGHPVQVLSEASEHALGLVVGTRGHGGFAGMLLGSVTQGVLRHAHCPVIAVPHPAASH
jgi:nucleotide-binding universal stress UspA family protein